MIVNTCRNRTSLLASYCQLQTPRTAFLWLSLRCLIQTHRDRLFKPDEQILGSQKIFFFHCFFQVIYGNCMSLGSISNFEFSNQNYHQLEQYRNVVKIFFVFAFSVFFIIISLTLSYEFFNIYFKMELLMLWSSHFLTQRIWVSAQNKHFQIAADR